jgi:hypothetical protein
MADEAGVCSGMPQWGGVAAADVPAGQAQPQVHPGAAELQTFLASLWCAWINWADPRDVRIGGQSVCGHLITSSTDNI